MAGFDAATNYVCKIIKSSGMKRWLKMRKPNKVETIDALLHIDVSLWIVAFPCHWFMVNTTLHPHGRYQSKLTGDTCGRKILFFL